MSDDEGNEVFTRTFDLKVKTEGENRFLEDPYEFQDLMQSRSVYFGDGGSSELHYPVRWCPKFLPPTCNASDDQPAAGKRFLENLTKEMARVADMRKDMQQNGVVEDIVDPELYPQYLHKKQPPSAPAPASPDEAKEKGSSDDYDDYDEESEEYEEGTTAKVLLMRPEFSRSTYSWIPTRVAWDPVKKKATLLGPIQNLPKTKSNEQLYSLLEEALSGFMIQFIRFGARSRVEDSNHYNICIKLQRYHIPPGAEYRGQWHTEGVNEEVSAVGVLYTDWPNDLVGGALKFRPADIPNNGYRDYIEPTPTLAIKIEAEEGSAMVFENSVPHRFCAIRNTTSEVKLTRSFVNFFVVDPKLPSTSEVPTNADIYLSLIKVLNHDVVGEILEWTQFTPPTHKKAIDLRAKAKAEMVATKGRWGSINYGNCGQLTFLPCGCPGAEERKILNKWLEEEKKNPDPILAKEYQYYYYYIGKYFDRIKVRKPQEEVDKCTWSARGIKKDWSEFGLMSHTESSSGTGNSVFEG